MERHGGGRKAEEHGRAIKPLREGLVLKENGTGRREPDLSSLTKRWFAMLDLSFLLKLWEPR